MSRARLILAVESSCDESAVALVREGGEVVAERVASQSSLHARQKGSHTRARSMRLQ
jgi:N6-L-threonylcarbamoyladenine synthase